MEEIFYDKPDDATADAAIRSDLIAQLPVAAARQNWRQWLGTDEAIRWVYLFFGLFKIILLMILNKPKNK